MIVVTHPGTSSQKDEVLFYPGAALAREQLVAKVWREDHALDFYAMLPGVLPQHIQVLTERVEVDAFLATLAAFVIFEPIAKLVPWPARHGHWRSVSILEWDHEVDGQPVLVGAVWREAATVWPARLTEHIGGLW